MTIEQKAKAYDKAIETAKNVLETDLHESGVWAIKKIFPELKESEDEKIRKFLIGLLSSGTWRKEYPFSPIDCVAWLEKQKEQKDFQAKVKQRMEYLWDKLPDADRVNEGNCTPEEWKTLGAYMELENFDKDSEEQKPAEWSEDDEHRRNDAIYFLETAKKHYADTSELDATIFWLKSLYPQPKNEWMQQQLCEKDYIKGFNAAVKKMEVALIQMKKK